MPAWHAAARALAACACSRRRARPSACPRARWATARSVTSTSAPAGRSLQDLPRIDAAIDDGSVLRRTQALLQPSRRAARTGRRLHLIGLIGPGGVHADRPARRRASPSWPPRKARRDVVVHALLDGRDTPPRSAERFLPDFEERLAEAHPGARIATVGGRYYGMDRDKRWERVERRVRRRSSTATGRARRPRRTRLCEAYARGENDEFVAADGHRRRRRRACGTATSVIHFNFRADRARQLTHALADGDAFEASIADAPAARPARRDADRVRGRTAGRGRFPAASMVTQPGGDLLGARLAPVPRRGDREVRPRHVLLQRRRGGAVAGRGARARSRAQGRDLRPRSPR